MPSGSDHDDCGRDEIMKRYTKRERRSIKRARIACRENAKAIERTLKTLLHVTVRFRQSLALKPGEGREVLARTDKLLEKIRARYGEEKQDGQARR